MRTLAFQQFPSVFVLPTSAPSTSVPVLLGSVPVACAALSSAATKKTLAPAFSVPTPEALSLSPLGPSPRVVITRCVRRSRTFLTRSSAIFFSTCRQNTPSQASSSSLVDITTLQMSPCYGDGTARPHFVFGTLNTDSQRSLRRSHPRSTGRAYGSRENGRTTGLHDCWMG